MSWRILVRHHTPVLPRYYMLSGLRDKTGQRFGIDYPYYKYVHGNIYIHTETNDAFEDTIRKNWESNPKYVEWIIEDTKRQGKTLVERARKCAEGNLATLDNEEILRRFDLYFDAFEPMSPYLLAPIAAERVLCAIIEKRIQELFPLDEDLSSFQRAFVALTAAEKVTRQGEAQRELLQIASELKNTNFPHQENTDWTEFSKKWATLAEKVQKFTDKYAWLPFEYGHGEPQTRDEVLIRLKHLSKKNPKNRLNKLDSEKKRVSEEAREILKKLDADKVFERLVYAEKELAYLRTYRLEDYGLSGFYIRPLFEEIAKRIKLTYNEFLFLMPVELRQALMGFAPVDESVLEMRRKAYAMVMEGGKIRVLVGEAIKEAIESIDLPEGVNELSGLVASGGYAKGSAKIVLGEDDFSKVKEGDIMLCVISSPKYNPLFERCSAVVANVGGMASHTAITSQEHGIPCVVGTQYATEVFRDNDLIEVDAEKGIVRLIERK